MAPPVQTNASLTLNRPLEPQLRSKLLRQMEAGGNLHLLQYPLPPLRTTLEDGGNLHQLRCPLPPLRTMQEDGVNHPLSILPKPILLNRIRSIPTWPQNPSLSNRKKAHTYHGKAVLCKFTCNCQRWTRMLIKAPAIHNLPLCSNPLNPYLRWLSAPDETSGPPKTQAKPSRLPRAMKRGLSLVPILVAGVNLPLVDGANLLPPPPLLKQVRHLLVFTPRACGC